MGIFWNQFFRPLRHPDKFQQKLGGRMAEDHRERIMARVNETSNVITEAWSNA